MNILAIETSCDETACAVVRDGVTVIGEAVASSAAMHKRWGGIVPEVAARQQLSYMIPVLTEALQPFLTGRTRKIKDVLASDIDTIAVTVGPGLIGSLLIGIETAKTLAFAAGKPLIPVNHVLAHMYANFVGSPPPRIDFPAVSLVASGGHTELFVMQSAETLRWIGGTVDDAAGEAFDKTARLIGLGGGGGQAVQEAAARAAGKRSPPVSLPRPMMASGDLDFSFSGLKTAVMREWRKRADRSEDATAAFASEVEDAITDVLVAKTAKAARIHGARSVLLSGGVAANLRLRKKMNAAFKPEHIRLLVPPVRLCTDNAVSIGSYAYFRGQRSDWQTVSVHPDLSVEV